MPEDNNFYGHIGKNLNSRKVKLKHEELGTDMCFVCLCLVIYAPLCNVLNKTFTYSWDTDMF